MNKGIIYQEESYAIQGAIFAVYQGMGAGFLEAVYQECLERELSARGIPFKSQTEIQILYNGVKHRKPSRADLGCYDKIILELKAVRNLLPEHSAQLQNYLRATGMRLGLLVNLGHFPKAEIVRIAI